MRKGFIVIVAIAELVASMLMLWPLNAVFWAQKVQSENGKNSRWLYGYGLAGTASMVIVTLLMLSNVMVEKPNVDTVVYIFLWLLVPYFVAFDRYMVIMRGIRDSRRPQFKNFYEECQYQLGIFSPYRLKPAISQKELKYEVSSNGS